MSTTPSLHHSNWELTARALPCAPGLLAMR